MKIFPLSVVLFLAGCLTKPFPIPPDAREITPGNFSFERTDKSGSTIFMTWFDRGRVYRETRYRKPCASETKVYEDGKLREVILTDMSDTALIEKVYSPQGTLIGESIDSGGHKTINVYDRDGKLLRSGVVSGVYKGGKCPAAK